MTRNWLAGSVVVLAVATMPVQAGPIGIGAFSGSATVVDMTGAPVAAGAFSFGGLSFSESSTGSGFPGWRDLTAGNQGFTDNEGISDITILLNGSYDRAGLNVHIGIATYLVSFFDASFNLLGSQSVSLVTNDAFAFVGWEDVAGIARINIKETSGENFRVGGFDLIRFEDVARQVPEPATLGLLGVGLIGLGIARGRRKQA